MNRSSFCGRHEAQWWRPDLLIPMRLGKHTLLYGESLMLGANGIAAAHAPIDVVKAAMVR